MWPDSEFEDAARQERQEEMDELERLSQEHEEGQEDEQVSTADWHEPFGRYKYGSEPNSPSAAVAKAGHLRNSASAQPTKVDQETSWDCPICTLPQPANDRAFNEHIDSCLSRQTIKDAVAEADVETPPALSSRASPEVMPAGKPKVSNAGAKRKASGGDIVGASGRRQKKLFFA